MTICISDYKITNYNLYCRNPTQQAIVTRLSASFVPKSQLVFDCITDSTLILNNSNSLSINVCNYCYDQNPCVINSDIIDKNRLFSPETYNAGSMYNGVPINVCIHFNIYDYYSHLF